jgi:CRISPR/Cas system CMR subunit Cmr4 (Cas7 group RAMP superfamily)
MNELLLPIRHVVRLAIEAATPISCASGEVDADLDAPLFRDWNGLPCLSGAALAGLLRSLHQDYFGEETTLGLFGWEEARSPDGQASRLLVSFGLAHDAQDRATDRILGDAEIAADDVLKLLVESTPVSRDHVAIDADLGAAADTAKFERAACPRGARFSLELALAGEADAEAMEADRQALERIVSLLRCPYARMGGARRGGYGRFELVRARYGAVDRRRAEGRARWIAYREAALDETPDAAGAWTDWTSAAKLTATSCRLPITGTLVLDRKGFWRFGSGAERWLPGNKVRVQRAPRTEAMITWPPDGGPASVRTARVAPIPGAGVKGALAHRAEFHLRRIRRCWASPARDQGRLMDELFGSVSAKAGGEAGAMFLDDAFVEFDPADEAPAGVRTRNSIDRHLGGGRMGKLFSDETAWRGPVAVMPICILAAARGPKHPRLPADVARALDWALEDLVEGRLAAGAGDSIGDGVMDTGSSVVWEAAKLEAVLAQLPKVPEPAPP